MKVSVLFLALFCLLTSPVMAAELPKRPAFFEALYDVPVMEGLKEIPDQAMLFDKPDGRIASVTAASEILSMEEVGAFYSESLPQLGWKKVNKNQYVRGADRLVLEIGRKTPLTIVHFTLAPDKP